MKDIMINGRYRLDHKIGEGGFGLVYAATDTESQEDVAIKLTNDDEYFGSLMSEADIYEKLSGGTGVPRIRWAGQQREYNVLVQDLLGPSLEDLFNYCGGRFSLKTTLLIADQAISRIQFVHSRGLLHRDIKPENFLMGLGREGNRLYLIDFGLAKDFSRAKAAQERSNCSFGGSQMFATLKNHQGCEQSRADDLEALGYVLLYLVNGSLPWNKVRSTSDREAKDIIGEQKMAWSADDLCQGLPTEFVKYINYTRTLGFKDRPDYAYLRELFRRAFTSCGFHYDHVFDWTEKLFREMQARAAGPNDTQRSHTPAP